MFRKIGLLQTFCLLLLSGCSHIHQQLGPEKPVSELKQIVDGPVVLSGVSTDLCAKPLELEPKLKMIVAVTAPASFRESLYFHLDQVVFTEDSLSRSYDVYKKVLESKPTEILVMGHTDTSASSAYNDALSMRRADKVKQDLVDLGIDANIIETSAYGEYDLEVQTPDETVEVRNRRVEIIVR